MSARSNDIRQLEQQLEKKVEEINVINVKLEEQEAENQSLKHKYSSTIRVNVLNLLNL